MEVTNRRFGRRALLAGSGAAAVAAAAGGFTSAAGAEGDGKSDDGKPDGKPDDGKYHEQGKRPLKEGLPKVKGAPKPIPGGVDSGVDTVGFIHWWLPGPTDLTTPILGIPGFGLDVDPSTITDFKGVSAMAVVAGHVEGSDGVTYDCEFDVRAMKGRYIDENGEVRRGAFAFL